LAGSLQRLGGGPLIVVTGINVTAAFALEEVHIAPLFAPFNNLPKLQFAATTRTRARIGTGRLHRTDVMHGGQMALWVDAKFLWPSSKDGDGTLVTSDVTATLALLRPNWQAVRYAQKNNHHHNREHRQQHASSGMHTVVLFCRELIMWTQPTVVVALSRYPFKPRYYWT
jgi:hypothetical protein